MRRAAAAAIALAVAGSTGPVAAARKHRLHRPPPRGLASSLTVDEFEWSLRPSKVVAAAGPIRIRVYNRGMDDHNLLVVDHQGNATLAEVKSGESAVITPLLERGRYRLICSLLAGTPDSHEAKGMWFELEVR